MTERQNDVGIKQAYTNAWNKIVRGNYLSAYEELLELKRLHDDKFEPGRLDLSIGISCYHLRKTDKGMFDNAIKHLTNARRSFDRTRCGLETLQTLYLLGEVYYDLGRYQEAYLHVEEGLSSLHHFEPPNLAFEYYCYRVLFGDICLFLEQYEQAVREYELARTRASMMENSETKNTEIDLAIGRAYHYSGDLEKASTYLEAVRAELLSESDWFTYYFTMLRQNLGREHYTDALSCFEVLQKLGIKEPQKPDAYHFAGVAAYCLRKNEDAEKYFRQSQEYGPQFEWMRERNIEYLKKLGVTL